MSMQRLPGIIRALHTPSGIRYKLLPEVPYIHLIRVISIPTRKKWFELLSIRIEAALRLLKELDSRSLGCTPPRIKLCV